jgi:hypothetical protein
MDIPEAARQAKKAEIDKQYPEMSKFPDIAEQFVQAQLDDEWGRDPVFPGGSIVESSEGQVHVTFLRAKGGNGISVPLTMPEAHGLYHKLGEVLGI